jgi:hypothetical protein
MSKLGALTVTVHCEFTNNLNEYRYRYIKKNSPQDLLLLFFQEWAPPVPLTQYLKAFRTWLEI